MNKVERVLRAHHCVARFDEEVAAKLLLRAVGDIIDPLRRVATRTEIDEAILELASAITRLERAFRTVSYVPGTTHVIVELLRAHGHAGAPLANLENACLAPEIKASTVVMQAKNLRAISLHRRKGPVALTWRQDSEDKTLDPDAFKALFEVIRKQYEVRPAHEVGSPPAKPRRLSAAKVWEVISELLFVLIRLDVSAQRLQRTVR